MKRVLLAVLAGTIAGCEEPVAVESTPPPTPAAPPTPVARATPKPGDWMWKDYQNPLEKKPGR